MCKFNRIGCQWRGPFHEVQVHTLDKLYLITGQVSILSYHTM